MRALFFLAAVMPLLLPLSSLHHDRVIIFDTPVDAISFALPSPDATVSASSLENGVWSDWYTLGVDGEGKEIDPRNLESSLLIFSASVDRIRVRSSNRSITPHPVSVSHAPVSWTVASLSGTTNSTAVPRILSREEWGADESLRFADGVSGASGEDSSAEDRSNDDETFSASERVRACEDMQERYPKEFRVSRTVKTDGGGRPYRWPLSYSSSVKLLVVHHTAVAVTGDKRPAAERVRAIYSYHAVNRGWGDVGYHFLIDEDGRIYEGRAGGERVVGGHAYCNNIGTVGVALLGNFETEKPPLKQIQSLQWLLADLAETYDIDLRSSGTVFHGAAFEPVVGHRDLSATACPGYFVAGTLSQVRAHVAAGDLLAAVKFPPPRSTQKAAKTKTPKQRAAERGSARLSQAKNAQPRRVQRILNSRASQLLRRKLRDQKTATRASSSSRSVSSFQFSVSSSANTRDYSSPSPPIRIRLTRKETGAALCTAYDLVAIAREYRGIVTCTEQGGIAMLINELPLEDYLLGLAEEPDTEPFEKQRAFAIAARTYAAYYLDPRHRKFPGMPYDGDDSPARFQAYGGRAFEERNPRWSETVVSTAHRVLTVNGTIIRAPYFSADDGRTRSPEEAGWKNFPFAEIFASKPDPWCAGESLRGHGVGMSGCGAEGQAAEGKTAEEILQYYYPGTTIEDIKSKL